MSMCRWGEENYTLDIIVYNATGVEERNCRDETEEPGLGTQFRDFDGNERREVRPVHRGQVSGLRSVTKHVHGDERIAWCNDKVMKGDDGWMGVVLERANDLWGVSIETGSECPRETDLHLVPSGMRQSGCGTYRV